MLPAPYRQLHTVNPSIPALYLTASRFPFPPSPFFPPPACPPIFLLSFEVLDNNRTVHSTAGLSHRIRPCQKRLQAFFSQARVVVETCEHACAFKSNFSLFFCLFFLYKFYKSFLFEERKTSQKLFPK